jgi:CHAD domain-containing protein
VTVEVEAKLVASDEGVLDELAGLADLGGYAFDAGQSRRDRDTFLDTPARDLLRRGYYLRRREGGDGVKLTLKKVLSDAGGVLQREELEMLVAADVPVREWPAGELRERVVELAGDAPLEPLLTLEQERLARRVLRDGREVAELSLDRVTAGAGGGVTVWCEVEVETRGEGGDGDLAALTAELRRRWPLRQETRSKFARALELEAADGGGPPGAATPTAADGRLLPAAERVVHERLAASEGAVARRAHALLALDEGLRQAEAAARAGLSTRRVRYWLSRYRNEGLAIYGAADVALEALWRADGPVAASPIVGEVIPDGAPLAAREQRRPDIGREDTMTEAAVKTLRFHLARMLEHEEGTRLGDDVEELHDMRVATRRMRMALRVFDDYVDGEVMRPVLKGLRRTGRTLGAVRDLDVFHEKTRRYLDGLPEERRSELDGLLAAWAAERERQRRRMVTYLDGRKYSTFLDQTAALLEGPVERLAPRARRLMSPPRVAQVLPGVLYKDMGSVWAFEGELGGLETALPRFHALRIACKGLRYTLEFFEDVLGSGAKPLIKRIKALQDHLGDLQDAVVTCGIIRDYITWGTWRRRDHALPGPVEIVVAPGEARYLAARQEEMERLILTFPEKWAAVGGGEFSHDLATVIAAI